MNEKYQTLHFATKQEWLDYKRLNMIIGGSGASSILGLNPYKTNTQAYKILINKEIEDDIGEKPQVRYGLEAERPIRELFAMDYPEYEVIAPPSEGCDLLVSNIDKHIGGTLDGILIERATGRKGVLEIKTSEVISSMQKEKWFDSNTKKPRIPDNYFIQLMHYLLITGYDFAVLHAQLKYTDGNEIWTTRRTYLFERSTNEKAIEYIKQEELKFINENLMKGKEPALKMPSL